MDSSKLLRILVLCTLLMTVQGPGVSNWPFSKKCPKVYENCDYKERNQCMNDKQCPDHKKCCTFNCGKKCIDPNEDICSMPKISGPCMAFFRRWWYDKKNNSCSSFIYGGCQGNNNNFQSKSMCQSICHSKSNSSS